MQTSWGRRLGAGSGRLTGWLLGFLSEGGDFVIWFAWA
jgi:hypothetical protein